MKREELRSWWLDADPNLICQMLDGEIAILIIGPSDTAIKNDNWKFGFQVRGERDIRWRQPEQLDRIGVNGLIELPPRVSDHG